MRLRCPKCDAGIHVTDLTDEIVKCPKCKARFRAPEVEDGDDEDDAPRPARKKKRKPARDEKPFPVVPVAIGGVVFVVLTGAAVAFFATRDSKPKDTASNSKQAAPVLDLNRPLPGSEPPPKGTNPGTPVRNPAAAQLPPAVADLFRDNVDRAAPTVLVPTLQPVGKEELVPPPFADLKKDSAAPKTAAKMDLNDIKKACVYIKVLTGAGGSTGSGFVIRAEKDKGTVLVATNEHVIEHALSSPGPGARAGKVSVVFDSGLPTEQELPATILAADPIVDLAVLRVAGVTRVPKPIDPALTPPIQETMPVRICGFPFGEGISRVGGNPAITIGPGHISSLRTDKAGKLQEVQINGALNPGNSGGPVVDENGRLIGIAVSTFIGSGIGFAVPVPHLLNILDGNVLPPVFIPGGVEGEEALFQVSVPIMDPFARVKGVTLYAWAEDGTPPAAEKDAATGHKPLKGAAKFELKMEKDKASGTVRLPAKAGSVQLQVACANTAGVQAISAPLAHKVVLDGVQTAADALPMNTLDRFPDKYADQVIVVRGFVVPVATPKWSVFEIEPVNDNLARPLNLQFFTTGEIVSDLRALPITDQILSARLTCRVGKKGADGLVPVRVTRVDFVGRHNRVLFTVPAPEGSAEPLIALNKAPEKQIGQTLECKAALTAGVVIVRGQAQAQLPGILLPGDKPAANLHFVCSADLATQVHQEGLQRGIAYDVRITIRVESQKVGKRQVVTVTKIEFLDSSGAPYKTLE